MDFKRHLFTRAALFGFTVEIISQDVASNDCTSNAPDLEDLEGANAPDLEGAFETICELLNGARAGVLIFGGPGAGKTYAAKRLVRILRSGWGGEAASPCSHPSA